MVSIISAINKFPYDPFVEKATSDRNTTEDWQQILEINDRVSVEQDGPKNCMRSIIKRLYSDNPWVVMQTLTLVDSLVSNCGKRFHLEVCSRNFENELIRLITNKSIHNKISEHARSLLKKWAQSKDFKKDPQLNLIPSLYERLKSEGISFHSSDPIKRKSQMDEAILKNQDYVGNAEEVANLAKAIELSIQEAKKQGIKTESIPVTSAVTNSSSSSSQSSTNNTNTTSNSNPSSSLYPSFNLSEINNIQSSSTKSSDSKEPMKVRALYDFEAAEDNELTFKAGEIILVSDSSDANWWKGSNHRGEGLFPANFVSSDLNAEPEVSSYKNYEAKKVQFNEEVKVVEVKKEELKPEDVTIDEGKIDQLMSMLQEADPKSFEDPEELLKLEEQSLLMMPLIDQQMEEIDKRHAMLTSLNQQLNSALNLYHNLMKESLLMEQMASMHIQQQQQQVPQAQIPQGYAPTNQYGMVNGVYNPNCTQPEISGNQYYHPQAPQPVASQQQPQQPPPAASYGSPMAAAPAPMPGPHQAVYQSPTHYQQAQVPGPQMMMQTPAQVMTHPQAQTTPTVPSTANVANPAAALPNLL